MIAEDVSVVVVWGDDMFPKPLYGTLGGKQEVESGPKIV
jgi:hypothetical protein